MVIPERVWVVISHLSVEGPANSIGILECFKLATVDDQSALIPASEYSKVVLEHNNRGLESYLSKGASLYHNSNIYKDDIDARIQAAYIGMKTGVKRSRIVEVTDGKLTEQQYMQLCEHFMEEFPEKLI